MDLSDQYALTWGHWDARVHDGPGASAFIAASKDEQLLELLAAESEADRKYERDVIASEIQARLFKRSLELPGGATDVLNAALLSHEAAVQSQIAMHVAGGILKANGDVELGVSLSAAAIVTLDTTQLALDAARAHLSELQAALTQSRVAERLVHDAAHAALDAAVRAELGATRIEALGHSNEAEAARKAARLLRAASDDAARKVASLGDRASP